jgi:hypothetical protein
MIFYTYMWLREDGTPYYVGKGCRQRAFVKHDKVSAPPKERILLEPHTSEQEALDAEIFLISYYGRKDNETGILRNLTDGGDKGITGFKWPKGKHPRGMLGKHPKGPLGSKHTAEWKAAASARNSKEKHWNWKGGKSPLKGTGIGWAKGIKHSADCPHCLKLRGSHHAVSMNTRKKISIANKGNHSALGAVRSAETRRKIGVASKARHARVSKLNA